MSTGSHVFAELSSATVIFSKKAWARRTSHALSSATAKFAKTLQPSRIAFRQLFLRITSLPPLQKFNYRRKPERPGPRRTLPISSWQRPNYRRHWGRGTLCPYLLGNGQIFEKGMRARDSPAFFGNGQIIEDNGRARARSPPALRTPAGRAETMVLLIKRLLNGARNRVPKGGAHPVSRSSPSSLRQRSTYRRHWGRAYMGRRPELAEREPTRVVTCGS